MRTNIFNILLITIFVFINFIFTNYNRVVAAEIALQDYVLVYEIIVDSNKPSILIKWMQTQDTKRFCIARKKAQDTTWDEEYIFYTLEKNISQWEDTNIKIGVEYEYALEQYKDSCSAYSYFCAGVDLPLQEYRGGILLLIDSTIQKELYTEIKQLEQDIIGDGWVVRTKYVPRAEEFDKNKVHHVKNIILEELQKDTSIKSLFIIGRVPVPYSGNYAVDLHIPEHCGAWSCDAYYQSLSGAWGDESLANTMALDSRNWNLPEDGKFDNDLIPTDLQLECGRVDMYNLPEFNLEEIELLRRYIKYNHAYKNHINIFPSRAIINDYFGLYSKYEAFASNSWLNFVPLVGVKNIDTFLFKNVLLKEKYLFSYACGPGSYESCYDAVYTSNLTHVGYNTVFSMLFGSWFGDWDSKNNLMRAMLASEPPALTCCWAGRPYWHIHHLGMGHNIGFSGVQTQNNSSFGKYISNSRYGHRGIHVALLGDPTLRMHVVPPVANLVAQFEDSSSKPYIHIIWNNSNNSANNILGYNIYRARSIYDKFEKINSNLVYETYFIDTNLFVGEMVYQVRAVKKEYTKTGSYLNQSIGKFTTVYCLAEQNQNKHKILNAYIAPNIIKPLDYFTLVVSGYENELLTIELFDIFGRNYGEIFKTLLTNKINNIFELYLQNMSQNTQLSVSTGLYYLKLKNSDDVLFLEIFIK